MKALKTVAIQVANKGLTEKIPVVQSDSGRSIDFVISDMTIPSGASATLYAVKPDKLEILDYCTISGNTITANLSTQTLALVGVTNCQVQIISGSDIVTTFEFALVVERSLVSGSAAESSNEFSALTEALQTVNGIKGSLDNPVFVDNISDMADTTKNYVLTSSGEIFAYNGSWYSTGYTYGLTQDVVSSSKVVITADNAANYPNLNTIPSNKVYALGASITESLVANMPMYGRQAVLMDYCYWFGKEAQARTQIYTSTDGQFYHRTNFGGTWGAWATPLSGSYLVITSGNYATYGVKDANELQNNRVYAFASSVTASMVANLPRYGSLCYVMTYSYNSGPLASVAGAVQVYNDVNGYAMFRVKANSVWGGWKGYGVAPSGTVLTSSNYAGLGLTDANTFANNSIYAIASSITQDMIANLPHYSMAAYIMTYSCYSDDLSTAAGAVQVYNTTYGMSYYRTKYAGVWSEWYSHGMTSSCVLVSGDNTNKYPDANTFDSQRVYAISGSATSANLPMYGYPGVLADFSYNQYSDENGRLQIFMGGLGETCMRTSYAGTWFDWTIFGDSGNGYYINTCVDKPITLDSTKRVFLFADSIGTSSFGGYTWASVITEKTGAQFSNFSISEARYQESYSNNIIAQINKAADWSICDYVIIAAGVNDSSQGVDYAEFRTSVENTIALVKANTDAKIIIITPLRRQNLQRYNLTKYASIINSVAHANDCSVINGYDFPITFRETDYYDDLTYGDGLHPGVTGKRVYAKAVLNALL